ncbi:peptidoglycan-recognition protein LC-like, partial [Temnothorax curvispinosus]|uniref:Peptidoglycan-recognition protein LC-like n=1 Tax=Temnothorax curvispinosus TaxID=300111 RepID=A0A6J1QVM5_9HYME
MNSTVESAEGHAVDKFRGEAGCSMKEIAVVAPDNDSVRDSSTQCSDVIDNDNEEEETDVEENGAGGWILNPPVSTIVQQHHAFDTTNGYIALPNPDSSNFSNVRVKDSSKVHLGNEVNYNSPVTIHVNHVVYTNSNPNQNASKHDASSAFDNTPDLSTSKDNEAPNGCTYPQNTNLNKVTQWLWTWKWHTALSCVVLILLGIIVFIIVYFTRHPDAPTTPTTPTIPSTPTTTVSWEIPESSTEGNNETEFCIVDRDEWGARPSLEPLKEMKLPVSYVIICDTMIGFCTTQGECANKVRFVQDYYMENESPDIIYNFLVGGDGF